MAQQKRGKWRTTKRSREQEGQKEASHRSRLKNVVETDENDDFLETPRLKALADIAQKKIQVGSQTNESLRQEGVSKSFASLRSSFGEGDPHSLDGSRKKLFDEETEAKQSGRAGTIQGKKSRGYKTESLIRRHRLLFGMDKDEAGTLSIQTRENVPEQHQKGHTDVARRNPLEDASSEVHTSLWTAGKDCLHAREVHRNDVSTQAPNRHSIKGNNEGKEPRLGGAVRPDQLPFPKKKPLPFKYKDVVRHKAERENLAAGDCVDCRKFYEAVLAGDAKGLDMAKCEHHQEASRHRYRFAPPSTPDGFWNLGFDSDLS